MSVFKVWIISTLILLIPYKNKAQSKFFEDPAMISIMRNSLYKLYNFEFDEALITFLPVRNKYKNYPPVQIFDCLILYWRNFPISTHPKEYDLYKQSLLNALDHTERLLKYDEDSPEKNFYSLLLNIMLARQTSEEGRRLKAMKYALNAYKYIKKGFKLQTRFSEYYFTTGLYDYYREFFPELHPIYKPFLLLFPSGNKERGLKELDIATKSTLFVLPEALMFSSYINLRYQDNPLQGLFYAEKMHQYYPKNLFFKILYVENLIQSNFFDKALVELNQLASSPNDYCKLPAALFKGMLEERHFRRLEEAKKYYLIVVNSSSETLKANENYAGLAYHGLGSIEQLRGNTKKAREYLDKACDLTTYTKVKKIACD